MAAISALRALRLPRTSKIHNWSSCRNISFMSNYINSPKAPDRPMNQVPIAPSGINIETFRQTAFVPETPLLIREQSIPALTKWFESEGECPDGERPWVKFSHHFSRHGNFPVRYEFVNADTEGTLLNLVDFQDFLVDDEEHPFTRHGVPIVESMMDYIMELKDKKTTFQQFDAPLNLLIRASEFNKEQDGGDWCVKQLYVAQHQISQLPKGLQEDLPVPEIVRQAGKGDIYGSSIWLGLEPTYTPLHRDPNPNLFVQMVSKKAIRLLPPTRGQQIFNEVQQQLGIAGHSRMRGSEMMEGPERSALQKAIWDEDSLKDGCEAILGPGDSLFIPKGWWHSVRSVSDEDEEGHLNASVNWWFR